MKKPVKYFLVENDLYLESGKTLSFNELKAKLPKGTTQKDLIFETIFVSCNGCDDYCYCDAYVAARVYYKTKILNKDYNKQLVKYNKQRLNKK